ncbi:hypothetical protein SLS58_004632 [Diplodia intermedia]|uniref:Uncharacterized protein n=1 Tax=Diplodia intermedia TaxID=856260 RepID=A0ABR3TTA3_9PEZI
MSSQEATERRRIQNREAQRRHRMYMANRWEVLSCADGEIGKQKKTEIEELTRATQALLGVRARESSQLSRDNNVVAASKAPGQQSAEPWPSAPSPHNALLPDMDSLMDTTDFYMLGAEQNSTTAAQDSGWEGEQQWGSGARSVDKRMDAATPGSSDSPRCDARRTALQQAVAKGHAAVIALLIAQGADVNVQDDDGRAPLHESALRNDAGTARLLLESGARAAITDNDGVMPLQLAAFEGSAAVVEVLLQHGASVDARLGA